jgi:hypothetical protein
MSYDVGTTLENVGNLMINYLPDATQVFADAGTASKLVRKDIKWEGDHIEFSLEMLPTVSGAFLEDGGATPTPNKPTFQWAKVYRKFLVVTAQMTVGHLKSASTSEKAARSAAETHIRSAMWLATQMRDFFFFGSGNGAVATLGSDVSGTTWTATDARMLRENQTYEVRDAADITTLHGYVTIASNGIARAPSGGEVVVTSDAALPSAAAQGDYLVWPGALNRAYTGLLSMVDDGTGQFQGVNISNFPRYSSPVHDNGGTNRSLTAELFYDALATSAQESGDANLDSARGRKRVALASVWTAVKFSQLYQNVLRVSPDSKQVGLAPASIVTPFGEVSLQASRNNPYNKLICPDTSELYLAKQAELEWQPGTVKGIWNRERGNLKYTADLLEIGDFFIKNRNSSFRIDDLSEDMKSAY